MSAIFKSRPEYEPTAEVVVWTESLLDGDITTEQHVALGHLLMGSAAARRYFLDEMQLHAALKWDGFESLDGSTEDATTEQHSSRGLPFLSTTLHATFGYFSEGMPLAYLLATVIVGVGLLIGSRIYVSGPEQVVHQSVPLSSPRSATHHPLPTTHSTVGRITGMVDCQWSEGWVKRSAAPPEGSGQGEKGSGAKSLPSPSGRGAGGEGALQLQSPVHLHDRFALSSGLLEITYDTGAKIILQGPVTYEVESPAGGYLSVGKLTARVENRGERREEREEAPNSTLRLPPSALFSVRTPTAVVTDLGTEFGVEVDDRGTTTSHVYRGSVEVQMVAADGKAEGVAKVLHENESARVENSNDQESVKRVTILDPSAQQASFVREIPRQKATPAIKTLDLVDVVAGGDGFSGKRNAYIDPTNGRAMDISSQFNKDFSFVGDGKYHRVDGLPFVDGVFIPNGRSGPVQTDSAGHAFAGFAETSNLTLGYLRAGGKIPTRPPYRPSELGGVDYAAAGHGLLFLHANKAITFNLDAIRRANPDYRLVRFRAVAGNTETVSEKGESVYADLWVLVDGQTRFRRREINGCAGAFSVAIAVDENDHFLTLAATDSGNGNDWDWILFGDPRLELLPIKVTAVSTPERKEMR